MNYIKWHSFKEFNQMYWYKTQKCMYTVGENLSLQRCLPKRATLNSRRTFLTGLYIFKVKV